MKWFIASDIHGSAYCCKMMLERYKEEKADRLLLLGDILYHGPRNDLPLCYAPKEVIAMLSEKGSETLSVRGNCDCEVDQMVLPFPVLADYTVLDTGSRLIFATHGHLFSPSRPLPMKKGDILLSGHTHVPRCEETDGLVFLNPGSVSIPKEGSVRSYMTLENGVFLWKDLESSKTYKEYSL
ncbi:MAG: phosphodiesterase [Oscillospiraceae bacterium]|nr:phosphodiesterase [Oscillospiraceae bacterium]MDY5991593.1 phosphodiesterase [Oscillospiraceae bacterium]